METLQMLNKIINMRLHLLRSNQGQRTIDVASGATRLKNWIEFNRKSSDENIKNFIKNNWELIQRVCPSNKSGKSILIKLTNHVWK